MDRWLLLSLTVLVAAALSSLFMGWEAHQQHGFWILNPDLPTTSVYLGSESKTVMTGEAVSTVLDAKLKTVSYRRGQDKGEYTVPEGLQAGDSLLLDVSEKGAYLLFDLTPLYRRMSTAKKASLKPTAAVLAVSKVGPWHRVRVGQNALAGPFAVINPEQAERIVMRGLKQLKLFRVRPEQANWEVGKTLAQEIAKTIQSGGSLRKLEHPPLPSS